MNIKTNNINLYKIKARASHVCYKDDFYELNLSNTTIGCLHEIEGKGNTVRKTIADALYQLKKYADDRCHYEDMRSMLLNTLENYNENYGNELNLEFNINNCSEYLRS